MVAMFCAVFPAGVFRKTFTSLSDMAPDVLYPIPDFSAFDKPVESDTSDLLPKNKSTLFLSINRYERKKNLGLAIEALGKKKFEFVVLILT
jgi:alpha-1,3/alpha-1,6-mannosyltransferase